MTSRLTRRAILGQAAAAAALLAPVLRHSAEAQEAQEVKFLFDVLPNPKHALFYPAEAQGYFRQNGLRVTLEAGKGSADVVQKVATGAADFGFADASAVILGRARGLPVKLVAMVHYKPLMAIITRREANVAKPADLVGKRIASTSGDAVRALTPALARANGFDAAKVSFVTVDQAAKAALLIAGQVDGVCDYASAFPVYEAAAQKNGLELAQLLFSDFGMDFYSNGIVVRDDLIRDKPELVGAFTRAIVKGLAFAVEHRQEAVAIFRRVQPQYEEAIVKAGLDIAVAHLVVPEMGANALGTMADRKMAATIAVTNDTYGLPSGVAPADVYTNAFIPLPP
jgi:NitT/TauT family transport system substrate-binding protein